MIHNNQDRKKGYSLSPRIEEYLRETLEIHKLKVTKKNDGSKIGIVDRRQIRHNDKKKVNILNKYIFQSLANLTYFFEFLNKYPELISDFENDIEELFGYKGPHMYSSKGDQFKYCVFLRFIEAILNTDKANDITRFRVFVINTLQHSLLSKINNIYLEKSMKEEDEEHSLYTNVISNDISRCKAWIKYVTKDVNCSTTKPHRIAKF